MPRTKDTVQLAIDVPPALRDQFKAAAKTAGLPFREFIEQLLKTYSAHRPRKSPKKTTILNKKGKSLGIAIDSP